MTDGTPWAGCFAAGEFTAVQESVALTLRILLSGVGLFLGWLLAKPVARGVYRLAFQQPIPPKALTASRLAAAILCGVLVFLLFPLGYGGGGGGSGGGKGPGVGPGSTSGSDKGGKDKGGKDDKGVEPPPGKPGETVRVELVASDKYERESGRWYLIDGKGPARTRGEVEAYLKQHKDRVKRLDILIPANSVDPGHRAVTDLENLARQYELPVYRPPDPAGKKKSE